MNKELRNALLGGAALAGAGLINLSALAQTAVLPGGVVAVQQSAARADAAAFDISPTYGSCTTTQLSVALGTLTITPPAGNYVYLASVTGQAMNNTVGAVSANAISTTNLTGSPVWMVSTETGSAVIGAEVINTVYPTGLKSTVAGTAVTLVPSATLASAYLCVQAAGWYSPL